MPICDEKKENHYYFLHAQIDTPPSSLMESIASPKMKTTKGEGVGACSLVHSISRVEECAGTLGWG
jgi:hypothetical protein